LRRFPLNFILKDITAVTLSERGILERSSILVKDGIISEVGDFEKLKALLPGAEVIDGGGKIALPGFINAHTHLYSSLARGMPIKGAPSSFREILEFIWWKLDRVLEPEDIYLSALVGLIGAVRCGVTSLIDHHASPNYIKGSLDLIEKAVREIGLRAVLSYEVTDRNGKKGALEGIEENVRFARKIKDDDKIRASFGLHASFTLSTETLKLCREAESDLNIGFHIHVAEEIEDLEDSLKKYGMRTVERLDREGVLKDRSLLIHTVHIDESEIDIIEKRGVSTVHNPSSNMNNAVGYPPLPAMLKRGLKVGLGTDGYTQHVLGELRAAIVLMRHATGNPSIGYPQAYSMVFENNPAILGQFFGGKFGKLEKGYRADFILVDYTPPTPFTGDNLLGHLVFGFLPLKVTDVFVGGEAVMRNGKLANIDEASVLEKARIRAREIWRKL